QRKWLVALILAGEEAELQWLTQRGSLPASRITAARGAAVVLLARAGELEAALAMATAMTGTERSESVSRIAEIAAATGREAAAVPAARLVADQQWTKRTLARARACKAAGPNCQFTTEGLSQVLPLQAIAPPLWSLAPLTFDWPTTLARVRFVA